MDTVPITEHDIWRHEQNQEYDHDEEEIAQALEESFHIPLFSIRLHYRLFLQFFVIR